MDNFTKMKAPEDRSLWGRGGWPMSDWPEAQGKFAGRVEATWFLPSDFPKVVVGRTRDWLGLC